MKISALFPDDHDSVTDYLTIGCEFDGEPVLHPALEKWAEFERDFIKSLDPDTAKRFYDLLLGLVRAAYDLGGDNGSGYEQVKSYANEVERIERNRENGSIGGKKGAAARRPKFADRAEQLLGEIQRTAPDGRKRSVRDVTKEIFKRLNDATISFDALYMYILKIVNNS